jgi:hypothetical protein
MKKTLLISIAWLALMASIASAGGINLAWNDCYGGGGATHRTFACNTNVGSNDLYLSFDPPVAVPDANGATEVIDLQSASSPLPAWWQLKNAGSCRTASLSSNVGPGSCVGPWSSQAITAIAAYYVTAVLPTMPINTARILAVVAVPSTDAVALPPGTEYTALIIRINNAKTVGTGCAGCEDVVSITLSDVTLTTNTSGDVKITNALQSTVVSWQASPTPTLNRTWGQVKSLYR